MCCVQISLWAYLDWAGDGYNGLMGFDAAGMATTYGRASPSYISVLRSQPYAVASLPVGPQQWHFLSFARNNATWEMRINTELVAQEALAGFNDPIDHWIIGASRTTGPYFTGFIGACLATGGDPTSLAVISLETQLTIVFFFVVG